MKKRILVPVDNTPVTQDVIKLADFWGQKLDAKLLFLHARNAEIQKLVDRGELINPKEGFEQHLENTPCESENEIVYRSGNPYQTILDAEQEFVPEMIDGCPHPHHARPCFSRQQYRSFFKLRTDDDVRIQTASEKYERKTGSCSHRLQPCFQ